MVSCTRAHWRRRASSVAHSNKAAPSPWVRYSRPDPYRLNLSTERDTPSEPGHEAQLHGRQYLCASGRDEQQVRRIGVDDLERLQVGLQVFVDGDAVAIATS